MGKQSEEASKQMQQQIEAQKALEQMQRKALEQMEKGAPKER
jgi:hypothetical protein